MEIEFPNSPGITITITRGGKDFITGEDLSDQFVSFAWNVTHTDPDTGEEVTTTERRQFLGP